MLIQSQPLSAEISEKLKERDSENLALDEAVVSQRMGHLLGDLFDDGEKTSIATRIGWKWQRLKEKHHDAKYSRRNRKKWRKTIGGLRPWSGFDGMIRVMRAHLADYIETEEKYGHSLEEYKQRKIVTAKETAALLERMHEPHDYAFRRRKEVDEKYPEYKHLITNYANGSVSKSGDFIAQGIGWVGKEAGREPREGYFELISGRLELAESPDGEETERLLAQVKQYHTDVQSAYRRAEEDSDVDFDKLAKLLKDNLYSWCD